jgi:hypothetical protein
MCYFKEALLLDFLSYAPEGLLQEEGPLLLPY